MIISTFLHPYYVKKEKLVIGALLCDSLLLRISLGITRGSSDYGSWTTVLSINRGDNRLAKVVWAETRLLDIWRNKSSCRLVKTRFGANTHFFQRNTQCIQIIAYLFSDELPIKWLVKADLNPADARGSNQLCALQYTKTTVLMAVVMAQCHFIGHCAQCRFLEDRCQPAYISYSQYLRDHPSWDADSPWIAFARSGKGPPIQQPSRTTWCRHCRIEYCPIYKSAIILPSNAFPIVPSCGQFSYCVRCSYIESCSSLYFVHV